MNQVSFPCLILKSDEPGIAKIWVDAPYDAILHAFAKENKITNGTKVRLILETWENDCSIRAFNLFHALRDRLAERHEDVSSGYKEHLKQSLKYDYGVKKELFPGTYWLKSTTRMTVSEMWRLMRGTIDLCLEEKAPIADFMQEWDDLKTEQKRIQNEKRQAGNAGRVPDGQPADPAEAVR